MVEETTEKKAAEKETAEAKEIAKYISSEILEIMSAWLSDGQGVAPEDVKSLVLGSVKRIRGPEKNRPDKCPKHSDYIILGGGCYSCWQEEKKRNWDNCPDFVKRAFNLARDVGSIQGLKK